MNSVHGVLLRHTDDLVGEIGQARRSRAHCKGGLDFRVHAISGPATG